MKWRQKVAKEAEQDKTAAGGLCDKRSGRGSPKQLFTEKTGGGDSLTHDKGMLNEILQTIGQAKIPEVNA